MFGVEEEGGCGVWVVSGAVVVGDSDVALGTGEGEDEGEGGEEDGVADSAFCVIKL